MFTGHTRVHTLFSNFSRNKTAFITESRFGDTFDVDKCCTSQYMCVIFFLFLQML